MANNTKFVLATVALLGALGGGVVGGYISMLFLSDFYVHNHYSGEASKTIIDVHALRAIRSGDTDRAIDLLEMTVGGSALMFEYSKNEASKSAHEDIDEALSLIRKYEADYDLKLNKDIHKIDR